MRQSQRRQGASGAIELGDDARGPGRIRDESGTNPWPEDGCESDESSEKEYCVIYIYILNIMR